MEAQTVSYDANTGGMNTEGANNGGTNNGYTSSEGVSFNAIDKHNSK